MEGWVEAGYSSTRWRRYVAAAGAASNGRQAGAKAAVVDRCLPVAASRPYSFFSTSDEKNTAGQARRGVGVIFQSGCQSSANRDGLTARSMPWSRMWFTEKPWPIRRAR
jgi:hypothetical protein